MTVATQEVKREFAGSAPTSALDSPPPFSDRRVFGPTAVFTALAIGSGELLFWPGMSLPYGAGVLWFALGAVVVQWTVNIEIGRYSLATGESVVIGATRLWRGWGIFLLLGTIVPWLWPGWARAGAQLLSGATGLPEKPLSIASLLLCGVLLSTPDRVYGVVERLQSALLGFIFIGVAVLLGLVLYLPGDSSTFWSALSHGRGVGELVAKAAGEQRGPFLSLVGGLVFAGAGGILNLGYGLLLSEKGFGMGRWAEPIRGLRHSRGLSGQRVVPTMRDDATTQSRWHQWMSLSRREHGLVFAGGNAFTIICIALTFFLLFGGPTASQGMGFLTEASDRFGSAFGPVAQGLFLAVAITVFVTSELGIIDITSRLAAGLVYSTFPSVRLTPSALFHVFVWTEIVCGISLTLADPRQPYWFLVTSAVLNTVVMATYMTLVVILNRRNLPVFARPSRLVEAIVLSTALSYGALFVLTLFRL